MPPRPALSPLILPQSHPLTALTGISLPVCICVEERQWQDHLLFTHEGLSGPAALKAAAEQGAERLAKGDKIVAEGYVREYRYQDANGQNIEGEEFIARRIGHDLARTRYEVDRSSRRSSGRESAAFDAPESRSVSQSATVSM